MPQPALTPPAAQHLPIVDLSSFSVSAERLGSVPWDSTYGITDNLAAGSKHFDPALERAMTKINSVQVQMKLVYGFM